MKLKEYIEGTLRSSLQPTPEGKSKGPREDQPLPKWDPPIKSKTGKRIPAMTNEEIYALFEKEDLKHYHEVFGGR